MNKSPNIKQENLDEFPDLTPENLDAFEERIKSSAGYYERIMQYLNGKTNTNRNLKIIDDTHAFYLIYLAAKYEKTDVLRYLFETNKVNINKEYEDFAGITPFLLVIRYCSSEFVEECVSLGNIDLVYYEHAVDYAEANTKYPDVFFRLSEIAQMQIAENESNYENNGYSNGYSNYNNFGNINTNSKVSSNTNSKVSSNTKSKVSSNTKTVVRPVVNQKTELAFKQKNDLFVAVINKKIEEVKKLIQAGADVNVISEITGLTPLMTACRYNSLEIVKELVKVPGINLNFQDSEGVSALHSAVLKRTAEYTKVLLEAGADVNIKDPVGNTALILATRWNIMENVKQLLKVPGIELNNQTSFGYTALHNAVTNGNLECIDELLKAGADVNVKGENGNTALLMAVMLKAFEDKIYEIVEKLLANGADLNIQNSKGETALHIAVMNSHENIVKKLLSVGADISIKNNEGKTARNYVYSLPSSRIKTKIIELFDYVMRNLKPFRAKTDNVYIPLGHSTESATDARLSQVPNDSVLVYFEKCGLTTKRHQEGLLQMYHDLNDRGDKLATDTYKNPVKHEERIKKYFGKKDLYIKRAPEYLPNIEYTLLREWIDNQYYMYSGLVPLDKMTNPDFHVSLIKWFGDYNQSFFTDFLPELFRYSVFPTYDQVKKAFGSYEAIENTLILNKPSIPKYEYPILHSHLTDFISKKIPKTKLGTVTVPWRDIAEILQYLPMFNISLGDLMQKFPGVYYHFMCRGTFQENTSANFQATRYPLMRRMSANNRALRAFMNAKIQKPKITRSKKKQSQAGNNTNNNNTKGGSRRKTRRIKK